MEFERFSHNGWLIWAWTGWKGTKSKALMAASNWEGCHICSKGFNEGDAVQVGWGQRPRHWLCVYPDNPPDRLMGQWLAQKGGGSGARYMEVNVDNLVASLISGMEYLKGESFPCSTEGEFITEHTPDARREVAKQIGLQRLKYLIDQAEAQEVEVAE